jgi:hypothetical protein
MQRHQLLTSTKKQRFQIQQVLKLFHFNQSDRSRKLTFHYAYIEYFTFSLKLVNHNCIYSRPTTHFSLFITTILPVHLKDYLCVLYYRDPADKLIRHRACSLRDTAYTLIKAEMDSDFEEQCKEISQARRQRAESPSRFAPEFVRTKPQASQATPDEGLVNGYSFIFSVPFM